MTRLHFLLVLCLVLVVCVSGKAGASNIQPLYSLYDNYMNAPIVLSGEPQPGDDRGRHGHDDIIIASGEPQSGDDRGGHGADDKFIAKGEPQSGDDRGGHGADDK